MKEVTAYEDSTGRLHKTKRDAIEFDFVVMMQRVWGEMPDQRDRGDPVVIARILASDVYPSARASLLEALEWFEAQLLSATD